MRCKTITIEPVKQVSEAFKERDVLEEIEFANLNKSNFKAQLERIERETKYATQRDCEQQLVGLEGMYKKKFQELKQLLKIDEDIEQVIDALRGNTQSESLNVIKSRLNAAEELKHLKLKCKNISVKMEEYKTKLELNKNELKLKEDKFQSEMTQLRKQLHELQEK